MARGSAQILDDDDELDLLDFMLDACGIDSIDFQHDERILIRENLEKNFKFLEKMVDARSLFRAPYFVIGYLTLITGAYMSDVLRERIINAAEFKHEEGLWFRKGDEIERKIYLKDFQKKIQSHRVNQKLHPIRLIYFNGEQNLYTDNRSRVIIGLDELQERIKSNDIHDIHYILLQGEGLNTIPELLYRFKNLRSLSLEFNQIGEIPPQISNLTKLKNLYLDYNQFSTFPEPLIKLSSLESLSLNHNYIQTLPKSLRNFQCLKELYVRMNNINKFPIFLKDVNFEIEYKFFNYP